MKSFYLCRPGGPRNGQTRVHRVNAHHWQVQTYSAFLQRWVDVAWFIYEEEAKSYRAREYSLY